MLIACDASMGPEDFEKSLWVRKELVYVTAPEGVSTCRSRSAKGELVEKACDYAMACSSQKGRISDMQVKEDFESRPHKAVTFVVQRGKERQEQRRYLDTAEKDSQEEARKRKVGRNGKKAKEVNKGRRKMRKSKKLLEALRGWLSKDETSYKDGIVRRLRMKKKKVGKKATKWQDIGKRKQHSDDLTGRRRMEGSSLKLDVMQKVPELVVQNECHTAKRRKTRKKRRKCQDCLLKK